MRVQAIVVAALLAGVGCGDDGGTYGGLPPPTVTDGGHGLPTSGDGGGTVDHDAGCLPLGDLGCLPNDSDGPTVMFTTPMANALALGNALMVQVSVVPHSSAQVDEVDVYLPGTKVTQKLAPTGMQSVYEGSIDISAVPSGSLVIAATAHDTDGLEGSATLAVLRDAGPQIVVYRPQATTYAGSAPILFQVINPTTNPMFAVDTTATKAFVEQVAIPVTETAMSPPTYTGTIDFHDKAFVPPLLSGPQVLHLSAGDIAGAHSTLDVQFTVDEQGPTITILKPGQGDIVAGLIEIQAQIDDPSDVKDSTVWATLDTFTTQLVRTASGNGTPSDIFVGEIDTRQITTAFVMPVLTIVASDTLDNENHQSEPLVVDNVAPAISLDPPDVHVIRKADKVCSHPFDPVGQQSMDDGDVAMQLDYFRARIQDVGNFGETAPPGTPNIFALVDPSSVALYVTHGSAPIIVDSDGDGVCDIPNPDLVPTSQLNLANDALVIPLAPLPIAGSADFSPGQGDAVCAMIGDSTGMPPQPLCGDINAVSPWLPLTIHLGYAFMPQPAIWAVPPFVSAPDWRCDGNTTDMQNRVPDGPICAAVTATDNVGNHTVSAPLRLCVDKAGSGVCSAPYAAHGVSRDLTKLPDCTGTLVNGVVDGTKPCQPLLKLNTGAKVPPFPPGETIVQ